MTVVICSLAVPDLAALRGQATSHPSIGALLDRGSYCTIENSVATPDGVVQIVAALRSAAAQAALPFAAMTAAAMAAAPAAALPPAAGGLVHLESEPAPVDLVRLGETAALCLLVIGAPAAAGPLAVLYGRGVPALGALGTCTREDLVSTCISLAGGGPGTGRHLLHERPEAWDPEIERQLTRRLRQLYGE